MSKKHLLIMAVIILLVLLGFSSYRSLTAVPRMFRLNNQLVAEGYYMGEFEFKMLGLAYYLDKGQYITGFTKLNELYSQLDSKEGLIKVPEFANKEEELEFYLGLQNPRTGAFMDDSYPLFTYLEPTINMLQKLEGLAKETGQPLRLKYPLRFLGQINTPEELEAYLDDLSSVGWIGAKLPKTPFLLAAQVIYYKELERHNLYNFSPEWEHALLQWFYEQQDRKTGFWGSKLRGSGELLESGDLGPTFHVVKLFVDDKGNNLHPEFPLPYKHELFATTLNKLSEPMPEDADLAEIHDWSLTRYQGIKLLTNFLWSSASPEDKNSARAYIEKIIRVKFEKFYIQDWGAFSLYSGSTEPDLDGTGDILNLLNIIGAYDRERQLYLWGETEQSIVGQRDLKNLEGINSVRLYRTDPKGNYLENVVGIIYPKDTQVLDSADLLPKLTHWVNKTPQSMGNWTAKEGVQQELNKLKVQPVPVYKGHIPTELANDDQQLVAVGFDVLQIPKYKITFVKSHN